MTPLLCGMLALGVQTADVPVYVAVLPLLVADDDLGPRDVEQAVARAAAGRLGVRALPVDDLGSLSGGTARRFRDCGADEACLGRALSETTVPLALVVVVNTRVSPAVVAVRAVEAGSAGAVRGEIVRARAPGDRDVLAVVERATADVLDELGFPIWARVIVGRAPEGAVLRVVTPPDVQLDSAREARVPPGPVSLVVDAPDYEPQPLDVVLAAGEERMLDVELDRRGVWWTSPWFWGVVGVAVAAGAVGTTLALTGAPAERCVCVGHPSAPCACP